MRRAVLALLLMLAASTARSQQPSPSPTPDSADLSITATVTWRELRFDQVGQPAVEFTGNPRRDTVWHAERFNLPTPVEPGVTYKNGGVRLTISSTFAELQRLLDEAEAAASPAPPPPPSKPAKPARARRPRRQER